MKHEVLEDQQYPGTWRVEAIDEDGSCYVTIFSGPEAESRAKAYADAQGVSSMPVYRVVSDGHPWLVPAASFAEAEARFIAWDGEGTTAKDACIDSIEPVGDLIVVGAHRLQQ